MGTKIQIYLHKLCCEVGIYAVTALYFSKVNLMNNMFVDRSGLSCNTRLGGGGCRYEYKIRKINDWEDNLSSFMIIFRVHCWSLFLQTRLHSTLSELYQTYFIDYMEKIPAWNLLPQNIWEIQLSFTCLVCPKDPFPADILILWAL